MTGQNFPKLFLFREENSNFEWFDYYNSTDHNNPDIKGL